jgi:hypothetical protein
LADVTRVAVNLGRVREGAGGVAAKDMSTDILSTNGN